MKKEIKMKKENKCKNCGKPCGNNELCEEHTNMYSSEKEEKWNAFWMAFLTGNAKHVDDYNNNMKS